MSRRAAAVRIGFVRARARSRAFDVNSASSYINDPFGHSSKEVLLTGLWFEKIGNTPKNPLEGLW